MTRRRTLVALLAALPGVAFAPVPQQVCHDTQIVVHPDQSIEVLALHVDKGDLAKVLDAAFMTPAQRSRLATLVQNKASEITVTFTSRRCVTRGPA